MEYREKGISSHQSTSTNKLKGRKVLTPRGATVGRIVDVHLSEDSTKLAGFTVKTGLMNKVYLSAEYVTKITGHGIQISITPTFMLKGKKVISKDGKVVGVVADVYRKKESNDILEFKIRRRKVLSRYLPVEEVKHIGTNIMLKKNYEYIKRKLKKQRS